MHWKKKRYRTELKKVPNFETNSKPFYDAVPNFEGFVELHQTFSISVKSEHSFVRLYETFKVRYSIEKRFRIRFKIRNLFKFGKVPFLFSVQDLWHSWRELNFSRIPNIHIIVSWKELRQRQVSDWERAASIQQRPAEGENALFGPWLF